MNLWDAAELQFDAKSFSGVARLFPLPNLVLYPHVMQPLHIFEPRYREMLEHALADDSLIAMALLEPGWEPDYESRPAVAPHACLGKIVTHHRLEDGRYNVLLLGVRRVRILREVSPPRSFREAEVEVLEDVAEYSTHHHDLKADLLQAFQQQLPQENQVTEQLGDLLSEQVPLSLLTDLAAYTLPFDLAIKQQLLGECRVDERARILLEQMERLTGGETAGVAADDFPPPFSAN